VVRDLLPAAAAGPAAGRHPVRVPADTAADAVVSSDGRYRYVLTRIWDRLLPVMTWVALNPSTADGKTDDMTVRKMCLIARRHGCGGIRLLNMFGLRATSPAELPACPDPAGPQNDRWLAGLAADGLGGPLVVAWGDHGSRPWARQRRDDVLGLLAGLPLLCLGVTASGEPRHPCRLAAATPLGPYPPGAAGAP
jgi:hypothetical protein